ncbi:hypothetical protein GJ496_002653 [Pomphorhynchus laevis]|nr:hypothetical protein GJ496_002653 [Pomphorhynchus laevis]
MLLYRKYIIGVYLIPVAVFDGTKVVEISTIQPCFLQGGLSTAKIMSRLMRFIMAIIVATPIYLILAFRNYSKYSIALLIRSLPILGLTGFLTYMIFTVAYRIANFNDCIDARAELERDISQAKQKLRSQGYEF